MACRYVMNSFLIIVRKVFLGDHSAKFVNIVYKIFISLLPVAFVLGSRPGMNFLINHQGILQNCSRFPGCTPLASGCTFSPLVRILLFIAAIVTPFDRRTHGIAILARPHTSGIENDWIVVSCVCFVSLWLLTHYSIHPHTRIVRKIEFLIR